MTSDRTLLARLIDIHRWLAEDAANAYAERVARDREIGKSIGAGPALQRVLAWWTELDAEPDGTGHRVARARAWLTPAMCAVGAFAGSVVSSVALAYEGDYPVNLFALLGVLVAIPGILLALTLVACVCRGRGWSRVRDGVNALNLNRLVLGWLRRLSETAFAGTRADWPQHFAHWQLVVLSQWMSIGFFVGALVTMALIITTSDIAFGWSTTLEIEPSAVHRWLTRIALPWTDWLAVAAPSLELVEQSRYFRLEGAFEAPDPAALGAWWPFVMMTTVVWGLAPRVAMLLLARWRLRSSERRWLLDDPQVTALLDRMSAPALQFEEPALMDTAPAAVPAAARANHALDPTAAHIVWNDALEAPEALQLGILQTEAERRSALDQLAQARRVIIFTKSWDPPLLEFGDFLADLRAAVGPDCSIRIVPVGVNGAPPAAADCAIWADSIAKLGDSHTYVEAAAPA